MQQIREIITSWYKIYKKEIFLLIFMLLLLKFSRRWQDSAVGYLFFPLVIVFFLRLSLEQKLHCLIYLLPWAESQQMPGQMLGITGLNLTNILFLMVAGTCIFGTRKFFERSSFNGWIGIFVLVNFIAAVRGIPNIPYTGINMGIVTYFLNFFLKPMQIILCGLLGFYVLKTPEQMTRFLRVIKLSGAVLAMYILARGGRSQAGMWGIMRAIVIHKNNLSFMALTLLTMNLATMNYGEKGENIFNRFLNVLYGGMILFTFSRAGYLSAVIVLLLYSFKRGLKWVVIFALGFTLFWSYFMPLEVKKRIYTGTETGEEMGVEAHLTGDVTAGRKGAWEASAPMIRDNFFFGQGMLAYNRATYVKPDLPAHPHNAYIQSMLDSGLVGTIFIVGFYVFTLKKSWELYKKSKSKFASAYGYGFALTIIVFLMQGYTGFRLYPYKESFYVWFYLGGLMWVEKNQQYFIEKGM